MCTYLEEKLFKFTYGSALEYHCSIHNLLSSSRYRSPFRSPSLTSMIHSLVRVLSTEPAYVFTEGDVRNLPMLTYFKKELEIQSTQVDTSGGGSDPWMAVT